MTRLSGDPPVTRSPVPDSSAAPARRHSGEVSVGVPNDGFADESAQPIAVPSLHSRSVTVPLRALSSGRRWRDTARWIGLALFAVGAGLMAFVFWKAITGLNEFSRPDHLSMAFNRVAGDDTASRIQAGVVVIGTELLSVLYLLLAGYLASAIASKGIQFFAASEAVIDEAVEAGIEE